MLYVQQAKLNAAVAAMKALSQTICNTTGHRVAHRCCDLPDRTWEAMICAMIASRGDFPDGVYPEGTTILSGFGTDKTESFPTHQPDFPWKAPT